MAQNGTDLDRIAAQVTAHQPVDRGPATEATRVEMTRAMEEVRAAVVVAQQRPRDVQRAIDSVRAVCAIPEMADRAFYRYRRGGKYITGPSIHLARELARCWGNIQHGTRELSRDTARKMSEVEAWAWDLENNTRVQITFLVPHQRDRTTDDGIRERVDLAALRDVYENNANLGARRLREMIFSVLPSWLVEMATAECSRVISGATGEEPRPLRVSKVVDAFAEAGVTREQLEAKIGRPADKWLDTDVAQLRVIYRSISRGETTRDEEFPRAPVTVAEILGTSGEEPHTPS